MLTTILSFTMKGSELGNQIKDFFPNTICYSKYDCRNGILPIGDNLKDIVYQAFQTSDAILFIGAAGIAVRLIAPYITTKDKDPAVIVIDELGNYVIPILSGHLGGANRLSINIAERIRGQAVLTTATDINQVFAVDVWAKEQDLYIHNMENIKYISSALLKNEKISFACEYELETELPPFFTRDDATTGIVITKELPKFMKPYTLYLTPRDYVIGIGCRKNTDTMILEEVVMSTLQYLQLPFRYFKTVATIDIKTKEPAIMTLCDKYKLKLMSFTSDELKEAKGEFTSSDFVKSIVGVDNVCERAAFLASNHGEILQRKTSSSGVTIAIAKKEWRCRF